MLSLIAVIGKNRELGKDNKLLWHIPGDLPRFRKLTIGHPIIMGRKTFESLPGVLGNRTNIVISSQKSIPGIKAAPIPGIDQVMLVSSLDEAIEIAKKSPGSEELFVLGGGQIYAQAIDRADRLYLTIVDAAADADTFFPDYSRFTNVVFQEKKDVQGIRFSYLILET